MLMFVYLSGKTLTVVETDTEGKPKIVKYLFKTTPDLEKFLNRNKPGTLIPVDEERHGNQAVLEVDDIDPQVTYTLFSRHDSKKRHRVEDMVLEYETSMAVKEELGLAAHLHSNYKFMQGLKTLAEIDGIVVHDGGTEVAVVECALSPQPEEVDVLLRKIKLFNEHKAEDPHFANVSRVIPVLAGKNWSNAETTQTCISKGIWRVVPTGKRFGVVRSFSTMARIIMWAA
jgi:hypothetical protein